jgi:hypothetical protein
VCSRTVGYVRRRLQNAWQTGRREARGEQEVADRQRPKLSAADGLTGRVGTEVARNAKRNRGKEEGMVMREWDTSNNRVRQQCEVLGGRANSVSTTLTDTQ